MAFKFDAVEPLEGGFKFDAVEPIDQPGFKFDAVEPIGGPGRAPSGPAPIAPPKRGPGPQGVLDAPMAALSQLLYGNPQGFQTGAAQLQRGVTQTAPAQIKAGYEHAYGAGRENLEAGLANIRGGRPITGIEQGITGAVQGVMAPLTGAYTAGGAGVDPGAFPDYPPSWRLPERGTPMVPLEGELYTPAMRRPTGMPGPGMPGQPPFSRQAEDIPYTMGRPETPPETPTKPSTPPPETPARSIFELSPEELAEKLRQVHEEHPELRQQPWTPEDQARAEGGGVALPFKWDAIEPIEPAKSPLGRVGELGTEIEPRTPGPPTAPMEAPKTPEAAPEPAQLYRPPKPKRSLEEIERDYAVNRRPDEHEFLSAVTEAESAYADARQDKSTPEEISRLKKEYDDANMDLYMANLRKGYREYKDPVKKVEIDAEIAAARKKSAAASRAWTKADKTYWTERKKLFAEGRKQFLASYEEPAGAKLDAIIAKLPKRASGAVEIADIAKAAPEVPKEELAAELKRRAQAGKADLLPHDNPAEVTPEKKASAVKLGGEDQHLFRPKEQEKPVEERIRAAYDAAMKSQRGISLVKISDIISGSGVSKEEVHKFLLAAAKRGDVTLHEGTVAHADLPKEVVDAGIPLGGKLLTKVVVKEKPAERTGAGAAPTSAALIEAGTDETKFEAALKALTDIKKEDLFRIANEYMNERRTFKTRKEAVEAIRAKFVERARFENKLKAVQPEAAGAAPTPRGIALEALLELNRANMPKTQTGVVALARNVTRWARGLFGAETFDVNARSAVTAIRKATGEARRANEEVRAVILPQLKTMNRLNEADRLEIIDYIESASRRNPVNDPVIGRIVDTYRDAVIKIRMDLESLPEAERWSFIEDYFSHQWMDPNRAMEWAQGRKGGAKEGSGSFTKLRVNPTIGEGIRAGLVPRSTNIFDNLARYVDNANHFIATARLMDTARSAGIVIYHQPGGSGAPSSTGAWVNPRIPEGYIPLEGKFANRGGRQAFAPEGWARVYNRWVSLPLGGEAGQALQNLERLSNVIKGIELGFSAFHAMTIVQASMAHGIAQTIDEMMALRPGATLRAALTWPFKPITLAIQGKRAMDIYTGAAPVTSIQQQQIMDLLTQAGARFVGKGRIADEFRFSALNDYVTSFRRGSLRQEFLEDFREIKSSPVLGAVRTVARHVGRIMETFAAPLFNWYIPRVKSGAQYELMRQWLQHNPGASYPEALLAAHRIVDDMDNRFGEAINDNIFWSQNAKITARLGLLSWTWTLGNAKMYAHAARGGYEFLSDKGWSNRLSYGLGMVAIHAIVGSLLTWAYTHRAPQSPLDVIYPPTGGRTPKGNPERASPPSHLKDLLGFMRDPWAEGMNKMSPLARLLLELATNKDWKGDKIALPELYKLGIPGVPGPFEAYMEHIAASTVPISMQTMQQRNRESRIGIPERMLGVRPASSAVTDPTLKDLLRKIEIDAERKSYRAGERQKQMYKGTQ